MPPRAGYVIKRSVFSQQECKQLTASMIAKHDTTGGAAPPGYPSRYISNRRQ
eukprot:SAG31_NODE_30334_length_382_cov_1.176678_1_plen_51_part_10